ncbi:glycosyl hydrolase [Chitinophaga sp. GbtcB8]|uniref:glycosyl hydrolase n=1 Tax=Chitinophaga sp. GbtcB8 TaxID=2824753 RepID=UPI001C2FEB64|nr:glycosyl hydrolase [Chitinophaga sp. GbtcB8]
MRFLNITLLFSALLLFSCSKKDDDKPTGGGDDTITVGKKGADFSTNTTNGTWYGNITLLKSHWFYTWGTTLPFDQAPGNCEFATMFWGKGNVTADNIAYVKQKKAEDKVKYMLGFNEPDLADQSNMSVDDALALWPQLESVGLPLGSPAVSWPTAQWFTDFMTKAAAQKRRVDFICVHMYVGTDDVHFVKTLQDLYDKYHLPIWITEFATCANDAKTMQENPYTPAMVLGFMQRLLPQLEALPFVQRYSWFSGNPTSSRLWSSALVDASGKLTTLGQWYAAYKPNDKVGK